MAQSNPNSTLFIEFNYDIKEGIGTILNSNIKTECIDSILEEWIMSQLESGKDESKANEKDIYRIQIICDLRTDTFTTISDRR